MPVLVGLPVIPAVGCPVAAGALGGVCAVAGGVPGAVASAVGSAAGSAAGSVVGFGVQSVLDAVSGWVTQGAVWLLGQIGGVLASTTAIDLGAPWFRSHYDTMAALAGAVVVPLLLAGVVQALYRQSASMLLRSVLVHVPLAVLLTAVAVSLVQVGLALTDTLSAAVSQGAGLDTGHFLGSVTVALMPGAGAPQPGGAPTFVLFLGGIVVVVGAVLVWLELLVRSAAVYVAVLFLPLALAGLAWPAISHWARRLVDTLAALVLSKLVIVAVLSLAAGALAGGTGSTPTGATGSGGGFASVLGGAALLLLAACAPWSLFRLLPFLEAGAVGHLEGLSQRARQHASVPAKAMADVALGAATGGAMAGDAGEIGVVGSADGGGAVDPFRPDDWQGPQPWEPGGSVRMMPPSPNSDSVMARFAASGAGPTGSDEATRRADGAGSTGDGDRVPDVPVMPPGVTFVRTLPRASGARYADHLGRDHLGPVLVSGRPRPDGAAP